MAHKTELNLYCQSNKIPLPTYATESTANGFRASLRFDDRVFTSSGCHSTKKEAENDVALVAMLALKERPRIQTGPRFVNNFGTEFSESAALPRPTGERQILADSQAFQPHHAIPRQLASPSHSQDTRHEFPLGLRSKSKPLGAVPVHNSGDLYQQKLSSLDQQKQRAGIKAVSRRQSKSVYQCDVEAFGIIFTSGDCSSPVHAEYMATLNALQALNIEESPLSRSVRDSSDLFQYRSSLHSGSQCPGPSTIPAFPNSITSPARATPAFPNPINSPPRPIPAFPNSTGSPPRGSLPAHATMQTGPSTIQSTIPTFVPEASKRKLFPPTAFTHHSTVGNASSPQEPAYNKPLTVSRAAHPLATPWTGVKTEKASSPPITPELESGPSHLGGGANAKQSLHEFCHKNKLPNPEYWYTAPSDSVGYICTVRVGDKTFTSPSEKTKKCADISAAHLALMLLQGKDVKHVKDLVKGEVINHTYLCIRHVKYFSFV